MTLRTHVLRPLKKAAVKARYGNHTSYPMKWRGKETVYSTEGSTARFFFYSNLAFGRIPEKSVTNAMIDDLEKAHCFADIGANLGYYTALARNFMASDSEVHTFEMDSENHKILQRNVELNPSSVTVNANNVALSDVPGELSYERLPDNASPVLSLHRPEGERSEYTKEMEERMVTVTVPAIPLNDYFRDKETKPDLVKIDVEGAEVEVLSGMGEVLPHVKRLYVEVHPNLLRNAGHTPSEVLAVLADAGFTMHVIPDHRSQHPSGDWREISRDAEITSNTIVRASAS